MEQTPSREWEVEQLVPHRISSRIAANARWILVRLAVARSSLDEGHRSLSVFRVPSGLNPLPEIIV